MDSDPMPSIEDTGKSFAQLYQTVCRLRAPDGCPWDREQTPESMRTMLLEEAFEAVTAIDAADNSNLCEELGDVLLIATMIAYMKEQEGAFSATDVLAEVVEKLRRRHPHVFPPPSGKASHLPAGGYPTDADGVLSQWNLIKEQERSGSAGQPSALTGVDSGSSPLRRSVDLQTAASKVGFDWDSVRPVFDKVEEELDEVDQASSVGLERSEEELGDLLFAVVNLSRHLQVDPLLALNGANERFQRRFQGVERLVRDAGAKLGELPLSELDRHWDTVKRSEKRKPTTGTSRDTASIIPTANSPVHNAEPP